MNKIYMMRQVKIVLCEMVGRGHKDIYFFLNVERMSGDSLTEIVLLMVGNP